MKIAITGKGGVGKTTISATLAYLFAQDGYKVVAIDADPDANLAQTLGISPEAQKKIVPIADMKDLIYERTGVGEERQGNYYRLNPDVDDIPEIASYEQNGVKLMVLGKTKQGGSGCYCPENVFLKSLLSHLVIARKEVVIVDMEAGIEHLTRGTSQFVDFFIVVVEPGGKSVHTAQTIYKLAQDLGVKKVYAIGNKITKMEEEKDFLIKNLPEIPFLGFLDYEEKIVQADIKSIPPYELSTNLIEEMKKIKDNLLLNKEKQ